jgi:hypothetical protein
MECCKVPRQHAVPDERRFYSGTVDISECKFTTNSSMHSRVAAC